MPGKHSRDKGLRVERWLVKLFREAGFEAYRIPLSGASEGFPGDLVAKRDGNTIRCESKRRKKGEGFGLLERWLADHDLLLLSKDRDRHPRVYMKWDTFVRLCGEKKEGA
jgi:hypothetical protein